MDRTSKKDVYPLFNVESGLILENAIQTRSRKTPSLNSKKQDLTPFLTYVEFHAKVTIDFTWIEKIEGVANTLSQLIPQTDLLL